MGTRKRCLYCGRFRGSWHSCAARQKTLTPARGRGQNILWKFLNAVTGKNKVAEGVNPDKAANRHRRINEGGIFLFSSPDNSQMLHNVFRRRRLEPQIGQEAWVKLHDGPARGTVIDIKEEGILLEFSPQVKSERPIRVLFEHEKVFGNFDPDDINTRPIRKAKDPKSLGIIKKNSRIRVTYYDKDVEGTVTNVRGDLVEFIPEGESRITQVNAEICSLVKDTPSGV